MYGTSYAAARAESTCVLAFLQVCACGCDLWVHVGVGKLRNGKHGRRGIDSKSTTFTSLLNSFASRLSIQIIICYDLFPCHSFYCVDFNTLPSSMGTRFFKLCLGLIV